jgi:N-acyl-D-amino-acid deacylase
MYDVLIRNGRIVDGTGSPGYHADIAVQDGKIVKIRRQIQGDAREVYDATGLTVTPGFIDSHSHGDLVLENLTHSSHKLEQGVTTEIGGMCGFSAAPLSREHFTEGCKAITNLLPQGVCTDMEHHQSFKAYLAHLQTLALGPNMAMYVGHNTIRIAVMGYDDRIPTAAELEKMKEYLADAMEAGAIGISLGLFYAPGAYADLDELIALCHVAAEYGGSMSLHMRNEGAQLVESVEEVLKIVRATGIKTIISHHKVSGKPEKVWGLPKKTLAMIDAANAEGYDVFMDQYPYTASSTVLNIYLPKALHARGFAEILRRIADPVQRAEIRKEMLGDETPEDFFQGIMISASPSRPRYNAMMLNDAAQEEGVDPCELFFDLLLADELGTGSISWRIGEEDVKRIMQNPRTMIGSDGLMYPGCTSCHPRAFGSFPRVLGRYVREMGVLSLEEAIRKMTGMPAMLYELEGKGLLRVGMDADIAVFAADTIIDNADFKNSTARCTGLKYVFVGGRKVVEDAEYTDGLYGKVLPIR